MTSRVNCKYHPDANLIEDYRAGDTICGDCGMVVGDRSVFKQKRDQTNAPCANPKPHPPQKY